MVDEHAAWEKVRNIFRDNQRFNTLFGLRIVVGSWTIGGICTAIDYLANFEKIDRHLQGRMFDRIREEKARLGVCSSYIWSCDEPGRLERMAFCERMMNVTT